MFLKPLIKFPKYPIIFKWIEHDYNRCLTTKDIIDFAFHCQNKAEETGNEVQEKAYKDTFTSLYSIITGFSYESKITCI